MVGKMGYNLLINGVYWGNNPLTNFFLTSWDLQAASSPFFAASTSFSASTAVFILSNSSTLSFFLLLFLFLVLRFFTSISTVLFSRFACSTSVFITSVSPHNFSI